MKPLRLILLAALVCVLPYALWTRVPQAADQNLTPEVPAGIQPETEVGVQDLRPEQGTTNVVSPKESNSRAEGESQATPTASDADVNRADEHTLCLCREPTMDDVRLCLTEVGVMLARPVPKLPLSVCTKLEDIFHRYKSARQQTEERRLALVSAAAGKEFWAGRTEVFFERETWERAVREKGEGYLRSRGYRPRSEAPKVSAKNEHQSWFSVCSENDWQPKTDYYPAAHLVRFPFGTRPEFDELAGKWLEIKKMKALLYLAELPTYAVIQKEKEK